MMLIFFSQTDFFENVHLVQHDLQRILKVLNGDIKNNTKNERETLVVKKLFTSKLCIECYSNILWKIFV